MSGIILAKRPKSVKSRNEKKGKVPLPSPSLLFGFRTCDGSHMMLATFTSEVDYIALESTNTVRFLEFVRMLRRKTFLTLEVPGDRALLAYETLLVVCSGHLYLDFSLMYLV